jgi:hypothetical protein
MCEYAEECTKRDDPGALDMWKRRKSADLLVYCPTPEKHIIAAVFELRERGPVLCTPPIEWGGAIQSDGRYAHLHAACDPLSELIAAGDEIEYGRCRGGTWNFRPSQAMQMLEAHREGRILPAGDLVKVRHANGQITKLGRAFAESTDLDIVGPAKRDRPAGDQRPYILGSYVTFGSPD